MIETEIQPETQAAAPTTPKLWGEANQAWLTSALAEVRWYLERAASRDAEVEPSAAPGGPATTDAATIEASPALETVCATFELSRFERSILLMCAGVELDSHFAEVCRAASKQGPTFGLALAAFPEAHWSALVPERPLRYWHLVEVVAGDSLGGPLTGSSLRIDESILHYLAGARSVDERLRGLTSVAGAGMELASSQHSIAERVARMWRSAGPDVPAPVAQLCGAEPFVRRGVAEAACALAGVELRVLSAAMIPHMGSELELFIRLWEREAALMPSCLLIEQDLLDQSGEPDGVREVVTSRLLERTRAALILSVRERRRPLERLMVTFEVPTASSAEQRVLWQRALDAAGVALNGSWDPLMGAALDALVGQFSLSGGSIRAAAAEALPLAAKEDLGPALWRACRRQARPRLEGLAQRIEASAQWDDLVMPERQKQMLAQIVTHVRQRTKVYQTWGFAARGSSGLGLSALFAGPSGTGKTMAGEVIANQLGLDICRIDLSQVISKYIGETEKNLRRVFDAAEEGAAILLFDEADALFGKRSEVKDSHDRYANMEVSYLLQRIEAYRGLAILTSNRRDALDTAFLRRIRFVVEFPFPEFAQRAEMWKRAFPKETPTEGLQVERLARLHAAGGNIRNIALGAAFLAAEAGEPVRMSHLRGSARDEFAKLERPLSDMETAGWA